MLVENASEEIEGAIEGMEKRKMETFLGETFVIPVLVSAMKANIENDGSTSTEYTLTGYSNVFAGFSLTINGGELNMIFERMAENERVAQENIDNIEDIDDEQTEIIDAEVEEVVQ